MKRSLVITLLTVTTAVTIILGQTRRGGGNTNDSVRETLITMERQLWEAWKNKDASTYQRLLSEDSIGVGVSGMSNRADIIRVASRNDCEVRSYSLENFQVVMLDTNTAILSYRGIQDATCGGSEIPTQVWASTVFVRRGGRWQVAFHQETPSASSTTPSY